MKPSDNDTPSASLNKVLTTLPTSDIIRPPDMSEAGSVVEQIKDLLFPRISNEQERSDAFGQIRGCLIDMTARALATEGKDAVDAENLIMQFLAELPTIQRVSTADIAAALAGDPAARNEAEVIEYYPSFKATLTHRIAHSLHILGVPFLPRGMSEFAHSRTGIDIHPGARIGGSFFIDHGTGVVIGETTDIGNNVKIYQGVTLGAFSFRKDEKGVVIREEKRHPTIEDNVIIYANATILGGTTAIGHDSVIGSSVWITKSVDPFSKVGMEPPKIRIKSDRETPQD